MRILASACVLGLASALSQPVAAQSVVTSISDPQLVAGIAAARESYCAAQTAVNAEGKPLACAITTNSAYMQMVVERAAESYVKQFDVAGQKKAEFLATLPADKRSRVEAELAKP